MYRGYALIAPMACTGAMWRMLRVGRILICVHTTNKDCLLLLLLLLPGTYKAGHPRRM